jgi:hypothetical protein
MSWMRSQFNPKMHTLFVPNNIEKYSGNVPIVMRSKMERKFAMWCDESSNVLMWSSETLKVPYYNPIKKRKANYYPDFIVKFRTNDGDKIYIIELKPESQTTKPKYSKRKSLLNEQMVYLVNTAKWRAAKEFCENYGYNFMVVTNESVNKR